MAKFTLTKDQYDRETAYRSALRALDEAATALAQSLDRRASDDAEGDSTPAEMVGYLATGDTERARALYEQTGTVREWIAALPRQSFVNPRELGEP